jgi:hypothetical protein
MIVYFSLFPGPISFYRHVCGSSPVNLNKTPPDGVSSAQSDKLTAEENG